MHDLRRKLLSLGNHFFERLKTANFSTACGTSTLKSLPSWAFFVSDVHLRPRKHFSRCTLDCGFKTAESPALRGFEAGPRALATAALYLVLLSNGWVSAELAIAGGKAVNPCALFSLCSCVKKAANSASARRGWYHHPRSEPRAPKTLRGHGSGGHTLPFYALCSPAAGVNAAPSFSALACARCRSMACPAFSS